MAKYSKRDGKMFKRIKNLFKKKNKNAGSILYTIDDNDDIEIKIDVRDTNDATLESFSKLFARVTTLSLSPHTIRLTKSIFGDLGEEYFLKLMLDSAKECDIIIGEADSPANQTGEEADYIKPSEMFNG